MRVGFRKIVMLFAGVFLASASAMAEVQVRQVMKEARYVRGDENVRIMQPADTAAWVWMPGHDVFGVAAYSDDWKARAKAGTAQTWFFRFRNDFVSDGSPLRFDVTADERFVLYLDGKPIARGPQRGLVDHWYYQSYEITGLAVGSHRLEAVCWQLLSAAPLAQLSYRGGLLLKAEGAYDAALTTGKGEWHVAPLVSTVMTGFGTSDAFGAGCQCRVTGTGFPREEPPACAWRKAVVIKKPIDGERWWERQPGWMLFPADRPDQMYAVKTPGRVVNVEQDLTKPFVVPANTELDLWWDMDDYYCAYPELETSGGKDATVTWGWAESLRDAKGAKGNRNEWKGKSFSQVFADTFVSDGRDNALFTSPWWRCGRWCRVTVRTADAPLTVMRIAIGETRYPLSVDASYACDDATVERTFRLSRRTMESCMHEMLFDCPYYEQQMYPGDTRIQLQILNALTSDARMSRFAMSVYDWSRRDNGFVAMNFPSRGLQESCTYTMCWVMMFADHLMYRNDLDFLRQRMPGVRNALSGLAAHENADGLLENLPGWCFMDWVRGEQEFDTGVAPCGAPGQGVSALNNLQYLLAIQSAVKVDAAIGETTLATYWQKKADRLGQTLLARFWDEEHGLFSDTMGKDRFSEHAQAMGILTGLLTGARRESALKALIDGTCPAKVSSYFAYYFFEALAQCGRADVILDRLHCWKDLVSWGARTAFETQYNDSRSDCHAWSACPLYFLQSAVAGIRPASPCYGRVRVEPQPGKLKWIRAVAPTPKGKVAVDLKFKDGGAYGSIALPPGLEGDFVWKGVARPLKAGMNEFPDSAIADVLQSEDLIRGPEVWLNLYGGNVRKDGLRCDLESIKSAGLSGVHLFHIGNRSEDDCPWPDCPEQVPVLSEKWNDLISFIGTECERLGLGLTLQNCPGWSQSGGPWIAITNAMRELRYSRQDWTGEGEVRLPEVPAIYRDADSDWRDVAVLAFPTPKDDSGTVLEPVRKEGAGDSVTYAFAEPITVRTLVLPPLGRYNGNLAYHAPWLRAKLTAIDGESGEKTVFDSMLPVSNWRDSDGGWTVSLACDECKARRWRLEYVHSLPIIRYDEPQFLAAARQTDWEGKSGLTLRSLMREATPCQDPSAWVRKRSIVDLTDRVSSDGRLMWKPPRGKWTVLRFGHVNTKRVNAPAPVVATGWECDKLSAEGIEANFRGYVGRLTEGVLKGKVRGMLVDSWECFGQTWTPQMERYFREANGYEVRQKLPALFGWVLDDPTKTEDFLTDWRRTIGNLITRNYYGRMAKLAHDVGIEVFYETAIGDVVPGDILEYWKYADAPMCEFWRPRVSEDEGGCGTYSYKPIRPCTSAAHIYGKRRVVAEAFTGEGITWSEDFRELREIANQHFARGVTHLAFQSYTHAPSPNALPPGGCMGGFNGTPFTRLQTWWKYMPEFTGWVARCEEFLEAGVPAQDILWYLGDAVDHKPDENFPLPEGYRADYLNHDVLTNRLEVKDGVFRIPEGATWRVLWIPDDYRMLPATKRRLSELAAAGGKVVIGDKEALVTALSELGLGKDVETEKSLGDGLRDDFGWIHRKVGDSDRYFVTAGTNGYRGKVTFRAKGLARIVDPVSQEVFAWRNGEEFPLQASQSVFVVFDAEGTSKNARAFATRYASDNRRVRKVGPWKLAFPNGRTVALETPESWSALAGLSREERAFSGTAAYMSEFDCEQDGERVVLDLGAVETIADVFVNGHRVRTLWCEPYACDITDFVRTGRNDLRIEVVNTWRNRVIFDLGQPVEKRQTWILYRNEYNPSAKDPFVPAGLLGPVSLQVCK